MRAYIIKRLLMAVASLFLVGFIVFTLIRLVPGTVVDAIIAQQMMVGGDSGVKDVEKARAQIEESLGLDRPFLEQYFRWIGSIITRADFGNSLWRDTPVAKDIATRLPVTLELGVLGLLIGQLIALPIGIFSALRQDTLADYVTRSVAILCIAIPGFWLGTMLIVFPSIWWGYMPPLQHTPFLENPVENLKMFILPAIVLGMAMAGGTMRITRSMMLEVLRHDYIRTAWAKGLKERVVVVRHVLKNALIPVITYVGLWMSVLIGGTVIIEEIFSLPGMGRLLIEAIETRDYTVVSGTVFIFGVAMVLINLCVDLTYSLFDPRVRYK